MVQDAAHGLDVVVGGQGDGAARVFRLVRDIARGDAVGTRFEVFRDATDVGTTVELDARGAQTLAEGAPGAGIALELAETATFRYRRSVRVGDVATVQVAAGVAVTDVVRQVVLSHSRDSGLLVSPRVGDEGAAEPNVVLARALSKVAATVRKIGTRR